MKLERPLFAQALRFIDDAREEKKYIPLFDAMRSIEERYKFLERPTKLSDYNYQTGVTFQLGRFADQTIKKFQIYQRGLLCEVESSTDLCDGFLDDVIEWLDKEFGQTASEKPNTRAYLSQLEIFSGIDMGAAFKEFDVIGNSLRAFLQQYSPESQKFEVSGIKMAVGTPSDPNAVMPNQFILERRADAKFASNLYFSAAPLRTSDHLNVLEPIREVWIHDEAFAAIRLSMMRIMARRTKATTVAA